MKTIDIIAFILLIIGGLNWGLVGVAHTDVVASIFGAGSVVSRIIYGLVGLAALWKLFRFKEHCHHCCHCEVKHEEEIKKE